MLISTLLLLGLTLILIYSPVLSSRAPISFDDPVLVEPIARMSSLRELFEGYRRNELVDLQPLRDLSYFLDFQIKHFIPAHDLNWTNLALFLGILVCLWKILRIHDVSERVGLFVLMFYAFHPVNVASLAWLSSRKHLLSGVFIAWATLLSLKATDKSENRLGEISTYLASCLSQPINSLWPLWRLTTSRDQAHKFVLLILMLTVLAVNYWYYQSEIFIWHTLGGGGKFVNFGIESLMQKTLILGRYIYQIFIPLDPALTDYSMAHVGGLIGLLLLPLLGMIAYRAKTPRSWLLYSALPLCVVWLPPTQTTGWDTYLLIPLFGISLALAVSLENLSPQFSQFKRSAVVAAAFILLAALALQSHRQSRAWSNDEHLWNQAYTQERTAKALAGYARFHLTSNHLNLEKGMKATMELKERFPQNPNLPYLLGKSIYLSPSLNFEAKQNLFETTHTNGPWLTYFHAVSNAKEGKFVRAKEILESSLLKNTEASKKMFAEKWPDVLQAYQRICRGAGSDCSDIVKSLRGVR